MTNFVKDSWQNDTNRLFLPFSFSHQTSCRVDAMRLLTTINIGIARFRWKIVGERKVCSLAGCRHGMVAADNAVAMGAFFQQ
jgi:hypothetical protein